MLVSLASRRRATYLVSKPHFMPTTLKTSLSRVKLTKQLLKLAIHNIQPVRHFVDQRRLTFEVCEWMLWHSTLKITFKIL